MSACFELDNFTGIVKKIQRNFTEVAVFFLSRLMSPLFPSFPRPRTQQPCRKDIPKLLLLYAEATFANIFFRSRNKVKQLAAKILNH